jgi:hypothetical protein
VSATHDSLGSIFLYCQEDVPLLFTENETNNERIFGKPNEGPYVKDGINNYIVLQREDAINPQQKAPRSPHIMS